MGDAGAETLLEGDGSHWRSRRERGMFRDRPVITVGVASWGTRGFVLTRLVAGSGGRQAQRSRDAPA
jgi:hypothetical protein